jgi:hypothetical protein
MLESLNSLLGGHNSPDEVVVAHDFWVVLLAR